MSNANETDYQYALLMEGKMDAMFLPSGAVAWLWQYDRPEAQFDAAVHAAASANRAGNPVDDANLLRADQNVLVLHLQSGETINVYPDGGYGSQGQVIDQVEAYVQGSVYGMDPSVDVGMEPEPTVELPPEVMA